MFNSDIAVLSDALHRIGDGEWNDTSLVANEVQVKFKLKLAGVPAP